MLLSYNFLIYYTLTSATFLLKDIFLKLHCDVQHEDMQLISSYKKAYPIVLRNLLASLKVLLSFDVYLTIFGSDYSYIWSLVYIWVGYYLFLLLTNIVFSLNNFKMVESKNNLRTKDSITVDGPFFILYVDPVKFAKILRPLSLLGWIFMINEYVILYFIAVSYIIMVLDCCNIAGAEMKAFRDSFNEQRAKIDNKIFFLTKNVTNLKDSKIILRMYSFCQKFFKKKKYSEEYVNIVKLDDLTNNNIMPESDITDNIEYILTKQLEKQNQNLEDDQNTSSQTKSFSDYSTIETDQNDRSEAHEKIITSNEVTEANQDNEDSSSTAKLNQDTLTTSKSEENQEIEANQESSIQIVDVEVENK